MPPRSARLESLPPYIFSVIADQIRELQLAGADVIRLDIGNPDMPPSQSVIEALYHSAAAPQNHGYTGYRGDALFRKAVASYYQRRFDVTLNPDTEVLPLLGSKEGIVNLSFAYIDTGDIALTPDVGYPSYAMGTQLAGGETYWMPVNEGNGFKPDVSEIPVEIAERARLLWVNYPNNPTGAVADKDFYTTVATFCKEHDILLVSDNPYADITFDKYKAGSALNTPVGKDHVIEFFSFSKSFNMAGWRLGAAVGSETALKNLLHVKSNVDSGHFKGIYDAGIIALNTPQTWIDDRNQIYQARRDKLLAILPGIGLRATEAKGSLYIWAKVIDGSDVNEYIEDARNKAHVSFAPGIAYGPGGENYLRMSIAVPDERLNDAINRLQKWYAER